MLYLARFELRDGENSYTELKVTQADCLELAGLAAQEFLRRYFDDETEVLDTNWVVHTSGYPAVKFSGIEEIADFDALIERVGYIGEKPEVGKPEAIIHVAGGVADIESKTAGVRVIIRDYDSGECNEDCPANCEEHEYSEYISE